MKRRLHILGATLLSCAGVASAQNWTKVPTAQNATPPSRFAGAMAYDSVRGNSVMFSGLGASTGGPMSLGDTWVLSNETWTRLSPATSPQARYGSNLVFDSQHGNVVMFGGALFLYNGITFPLSDTWTWNGTTWSQVSTTNSPSKRYLYSMAYDPAHHQVVLFGGVNSVGYLADTWVFDGSNWTRLSPASSPSARGAAAMTFDGVSNQIVLFGGVDFNASKNDTWTWNGSTWTQASPATSPSARYGAQFAYDTAQAQSVLSGGTTSAGNFSDTWAWRGNNWVQLFPATNPGMRFYGCYVYDTVLNRIVMFSGGQGTQYGDIYLNDTWTWQ